MDSQDTSANVLTASQKYICSRPGTDHHYAFYRRGPGSTDIAKRPLSGRRATFLHIVCGALHGIFIWGPLTHAH
jgi:hypothetical protein